LDPKISKTYKLQTKTSQTDFPAQTRLQTDFWVSAWLHAER